jgi:hypothetical protein
MGGVTLPVIEQNGMVPVVKADTDSINFEYKSTSELGISEPGTDTLYRGGWRIYEATTPLYSEIIAGTPNAKHFIEGVGIIKAASVSCYRLSRFNICYYGDGETSKVTHTEYGVTTIYLGGSLPALGNLTTTITGGNIRLGVTNASGNESGLKLYYRIWTFT